MEVDVGTEIPEASEYAFLNTQPYSRKIERGESPQAPEGVFQVVATLAQSRFGNIAKITFSYRAVMGGAIGAWAMTPSARSLAARSGSTGSSDIKRTEWLTRSPAIIITVK